MKRGKFENETRRKGKESFVFKVGVTAAVTVGCIYVYMYVCVCVCVCVCDMCVCVRMQTCEREWESE